LLLEKATPLTICFLKKQCTMFAYRKSNATHYLLFEKSSILRYCLLLEKQRHLLFAFRKANSELLYEKMLRVGLLPLFKAPILISKGHQKSDA